jgi:hypothetical protein
LCLKPIDYRRKEALTPELIHKYIKKLNAVLKKYNIQVVDIWNIDEAGFRVRVIHGGTVITHKTVKFV